MEFKMRLQSQANRRNEHTRLRARLSPIATLASTLLLTLAACTPARWHETAAKHTGDVVFEKQTRPANSPPLKRGQGAFVSSNRLRARTSPDQPGEEAPVVLEKNDQVEVVDPEPKGKDGLIEVRVPNKPAPVEQVGEPVAPQTQETPPAPTTLYVSPEYLADKPVPVDPEEANADKYFVIQNIASEKLRVYERCAEKNCAHKLILETDMAAGENTPDKKRQSILGSYRITKWFKFYQDADDQYPSWFNPAYPELPPPGSPLKAWTSKTLLPNGKGYVRGAFGWYTAHIGPNAATQWTHGTYGWGADEGRFVRLSTKDIAGLNVDPRSHGCTRIENQAIAFLRQILPVGTKVIKIYAKENLRDKNLTRYSAKETTTWQWLLTKDGVREDGPKAGRSSQLKRDIQPQEILEEGTYVLDQHPDAVDFAAGKNHRANIYRVPEKSLKGVFYVDEGRLAGYLHPKELKVGGYSDKVLPSIVTAK